MLPAHGTTFAREKDARELVSSTKGREPGLQTDRTDVGRHSHDPIMASASLSTFLETKLPFRELSLIAKADQRVNDPIYGNHRWFARRPPGVMRGLLIAAAHSGDLDLSEYWRLFASAEKPLAGLRVHDLFVGGGTTLVEAARLGALPSGTDVDPLAIEIVKHELDLPDASALRSAASELSTYVEREVGWLFKKQSKAWTPLHYFWVRRVTCPHCATVSTLHRNLFIARNLKKHGSVQRHEAMVVFCPDCLTVHHLMSLNRRQLRCCRRRSLAAGNFTGWRFRCEACGGHSTHGELKTATAPAWLLAVEETSESDYRRIRQAKKSDLELVEAGDQYLSNTKESLSLPTAGFELKRTDNRPLSFGAITATDLFTSRQLAFFGHAFKWIQESKYSGSVRRALTLAISNCLSTNNVLCGYATDYGRLAPLFSVRGYSMPALSVELNPTHATSGRGTLRSSLQKAIRSTVPITRRNVWCERTSRVRPTLISFEHSPANIDGILCASAASPIDERPGPVDLCVFDPPYFDYIAYSELSEFYRLWLNKTTLGGKPLLPDPANPIGSFSSLLSTCFTCALSGLKLGRPLVFTFHSASNLAWEAIGLSLDAAQLLVTALWPLKNDSHMGHHSKAGNREWDVCVVCRPSADCERCDLKQDVLTWAKRVKPLKISNADRESLNLAIEMARKRFGQLPGKTARNTEDNKQDDRGRAS